MAFLVNRILMLLYKCFCFFKVMDQMFLTIRGAVQGSFRATQQFNLDFSSGIFDL